MRQAQGEVRVDVLRIANPVVARFIYRRKAGNTDAVKRDRAGICIVRASG